MTATFSLQTRGAGGAWCEACNSEETPEVTSENYFDCADGLFWFCVDYHSGQCALEYKPARSHFSFSSPNFEDNHNFERQDGRRFYSALVRAEKAKKGGADALAEKYLSEIQKFTS